MSRDRGRTALFETRHPDPAAAAAVAAALRPDNTSEIRTGADGSTVRTRIERERTGGLQASADDYLVNLAVATTVVADAREATGGAESDATAGDGEPAATNTNGNADADGDAPTDTQPNTDTDTL